MTTRARSRKAGFTLVELLVVVGIIIVATAMALPAINQFLKGQKLVQAGRLTQSAFSEARRAAITQRARHWIFIGRITGNAGEPDIYAFAHYREGKGWEPGITKLPSSVQPVLAPPGGGPGSRLRGCGLPIQDWTNGLPSSSSAQAPVDLAGAVVPFADGGATPTFTIPRVGSARPTYEFKKDGTIVLNDAADIAPVTNPKDIYDLNVPIEVISATELSDMCFEQIGEPSKRCFIDVDPNTGRVRFRVAETQAQDGSGNNSTR